MRTIELGPWTLEVDREATEVAYAEIIDGAEDCTCAHCQHWAAHRDDIIAAPVRDFLESLGIDYRREAEVYDLDPRPALHLCAGWYHFIGRLTGGPRSREIPDASGTTIEMPDPHPIAPGFTVVPHDLYAHVMKPAIQAAAEGGASIVTLEFWATSHRIEHEFPPRSVWRIFPR